jgi:TatD DNase family protein
MVIENEWVCTVGPTILNSPHMDHFIENQPLELLGLETDSPIPFDGKPSSPAWIPLVARRVAEIKKVPIERVQEAQSLIFSRFFPHLSLNEKEK